MIFAGVDTETTGLDPALGHRIIEIGILIYDEHGHLLDEWEQRIDPKRPIDAKAQAVHGIDYSELLGKPTWKDVAATVHSKLSQADLIVGHNVGFDITFIESELNRSGRSIPSDIGLFCTMENARWATFDGKNPNLRELCMALRVDYDRSAAHAAKYDIERTMKCFFKARARGFFNPALYIASNGVRT